MKVDQDVTVACTQAVRPVPFIYKPWDHSQIDAVSKNFYVSAMEALDAAGLPFLVGGAYAFAHYAGIERHTKDFDIFVKKEDADRILDALEKTLGCKADRTYPHWLYKAILGENFIDIIFSSGNGVAIVDNLWFEKAHRGMVLGVNALLIPAEEMIWSKGYIMERERFDGADVAHTFRGWGHKMDWQRLIDRYDKHWRVLFSHLVLFGYIYPLEKYAIPNWVMTTLAQKLIEDTTSPTLSSSDPISSSLTSSAPFLSSAPLPPPSSRLCQGTLLSRQQYLKDVAEWQYEDARTLKVDGMGPFMSESDVAHWTASALGSHAGHANS